MSLFERRYLAIYLQDHYAGATVGLELARRASGENRNTPLGHALTELTEEIEWDRDRLREIMRFCEVEPHRLKVAGGWTGEKFGRLKLNGEVRSYSPLPRLVELEGLFAGINGKLSLWRNLERALGLRLASFDLPLLITRAESQRDRIEELRLNTAAETLRL